jgi:two-component system LytT family response regulator
MVVLRLLIADDEAVARERLRGILVREPGVEIVAECRTGAEALEALRREKPDAAFLDVEMPGMSGIEVARAVAEGDRPVVVFATAYSQHAVQAFDVQAADFLLKPYRLARLQQALGRVRAAVAARSAGSDDDPAGGVQPRLQRLIVRTNDRMLVIAAGSVDWIESAGNYAVLHVGPATHVLRETLSELEARLADGQFLRVSRTSVVNLDRVRELRMQPDGTHEMVIEGGVRLPITRGIREVQARLEHG